MKSIQNILQANGEEFMDSLMNDYLVVYEKLNASTLSFRRIKNELKFYKGRDNEEITPINETLYSYFKEGIEYIKRVSLIFYMEFPEGWLFRMQYFNPNSPGLINYEQQPKNNLVLSCIDTGSNVIEDLNVLRRWSERLQVDIAEPLFSGFLSEFQKEKLLDYVNGNCDCEGVPFSQYIISLLNPAISHSAFSDTFNTGIDSFIFKFYNANSKKCVPAKLVDPYMDKLVQQNKDKFGNNSGTENEIILVNFIAWLQTVNLKDIDVKGDTSDERYMDLLCKLFNQYMGKEQKFFSNLKSNINESYKVDIAKIKNTDTINLLKSNPSIEKAFQVIVGSFVNQKDNADDPASIIDSNLKEIFNKEVEDIKKTIAVQGEDKVMSFTDLMSKNMNDVEKPAEESKEKVMSFSELMDKVGYSETEQKEETPKKLAKEEKTESAKKEKEESKEEKEESKEEKEEPKEEKEESKEEKDSKDVSKSDDSNSGESSSSESNDKKDESTDEEKPEDKKDSGHDDESKESEDSTDEEKSEDKKDSEPDTKNEDSADKEKTEEAKETKDEDSDKEKDEEPKESNIKDEAKSKEKDESTPESKDKPEESKPEKQAEDGSKDAEHVKEETTKQAAPKQEVKEKPKKEKAEKEDAPSGIAL